MPGRVRDIRAKTILNRVRQPDPWYGLSYSMNLYRGCQHRCIYCDSRSNCYGIDAFDTEILVKSNAVELLRDELSTKRIRGTIGTGSMNDPYMPLETQVRLTGRALEVIREFRFPVHILTKSSLVTRDRELLRDISETGARVSFTITAADDELASVIEPGAPSPTARFSAMAELAQAGVTTGVMIMPVLPFIEDTWENIETILRRAAESGAGTALPWFGVTLRDRQREYFYRRLDEHFEGLSGRYSRAFGDNYFCESPGAGDLSEKFSHLCNELGLSTRIEPFEKQPPEQMQLFDTEWNGKE